VPVHGNAVFIARRDADGGLALSTREKLRRGVRRLRRRWKQR
jgi:hypothetical protein